MRSANIPGEEKQRPGITPQGPANPHGFVFMNHLKHLHCPEGYQELGPSCAMTSDGPSKGEGGNAAGGPAGHHLPSMLWSYSSKGRAGPSLLVPTLAEAAGWRSGRRFVTSHCYTDKHCYSHCHSQQD